MLTDNEVFYDDAQFQTSVSDRLTVLTTNPNEFKLEFQKPSNVNYVDP